MPLKKPLRYDFAIETRPEGVRLKGVTLPLSHFRRNGVLTDMLERMETKVTAHVRHARGLRVRKAGFVVEGNRATLHVFPV